MKIIHWTMFNRSGMNRVAESLALAERKVGIETYLCNPHEQSNEEMWEKAKDADIHVTHTHFPDWFRRRCTHPYKQVYVVHGTPDHTFHSSVEQGLPGGYGHGDPFMLYQYWLQNSDAVVTFWPRHAAIHKQMCDKHKPVHCIPLGIDKTFWCPGPTPGKFAGSPSLFTSENCHYIKWPYDLFIAWPMANPRIKGNPVLHAAYLPTDQHRWFFPLVNRNGCSYASHISRGAMEHSSLRDALRSVDFYIGLVRCGDFNRMSLEANACGVKTISYVGNPYSDFWIPEGDQRTIADHLVAICNGEVEPRKKDPVIDISETCKQMLEIYASL